MTGACLFVCVVGPGFDSTYPAFVRSRASHAAGSDGRLPPQKRNRAPISGGRVVLTPFVHMSVAFQSRAGCVFGTRCLGHQTILFHSSVHCFPTSLNIIRSPKEQGCASWEHCNMCAVVSFAFPHAHVVTPV